MASLHVARYLLFVVCHTCGAFMATSLQALNESAHRSGNSRSDAQPSMSDSAVRSMMPLRYLFTA
jgi:hypothetical protein